MEKHELSIDKIKESCKKFLNSPYRYKVVCRGQGSHKPQMYLVKLRLLRESMTTEHIYTNEFTRLFERYNTNKVEVMSVQLLNNHEVFNKVKSELASDYYRCYEIGTILTSKDFDYNKKTGGIHYYITQESAIGHFDFVPSRYIGVVQWLDWNPDKTKYWLIMDRYYNDTNRNKRDCKHVDYVYLMDSSDKSSDNSKHNSKHNSKYKCYKISYL